MKHFFLIPFLLLSIFAYSQTNYAGVGYPKDYFRNPLDIPIFLAGNFGECRPGHFHSGIDIKTLGEENQPVRAAAEGYISRIKMEKGGFGHAIYINHPNGYTTLYAHLSNFAPEIQQYVKEQQYIQQRWDVDLAFAPSDLPVDKGQQIAWSGNTGSSTAPHLHFEIRNTITEHPLNPELFGFPVIDKVPPVIAEVVFYSGNIYEDSMLLVSLAKTGEAYKLQKTDKKSFYISKDTVDVWNSLTGIGINVDDYMDSSTNTLSPYNLKLYMDDGLQSQVALDDIGYEETRYINAYADYKTHELTGKWMQCLFKLPGNRLDKIYSNLNSNNGLLDLRNNKMHKIRIEITDDCSNSSSVSFYVKPIKIFIPATPLPGSIKFAYNQTNTFNYPNVSFVLDNKQLYDDIFFRFDKKADNKALSERFMLHHSYVPLHHYFELRIKPNKTIPIRLRNKVALLYSDGEDETGSAANFTSAGWYMAKVRNFGEYWLMIDTIPPVIKSLQKTANLTSATQITFEVKDSMTSVKSFSGHLDGKWICFEQHANLFFYKFDEHCTKGKHKLIFDAEDENGNKRTFQYNFVR